eukprot:Skav223274  [mRNA]  locus=scaffold3424:172965:177320:+ [translate_table: standard]
MISPLANRPLWEACESTAHDGIFWRSQQHGTDSLGSINVAVKIFDIGHSQCDLPVGYEDHRVCRGWVVEPSLAEIRMTPENKTHKVTSQMIHVLVHPKHVNLLTTMQSAVNTQDTACLIAVQVMWHHDSFFAVISERCSGIAIWPSKLNTTSIKCAELFCGGYAGWDMAIGYLRELGVDIRTKVAVDTSIPATQMYALNHKGRILGLLEDPRASNLQVPDDEVLVLPKPVQLPCWYHVLDMLGVQFWCISPPCPAFSRATDMQGFLRADGKLTLETICTIRLCQPFVIALENVPGLAEEDNLRIMTAMFRWAGYVLHFHECNDMSDVSPTTRSRWLSVWLRQDIASQGIPLRHSWFKAREYSIGDFGVLNLQFDPDILRDFLLTSEQVEIYGDAAFLPYAMKKNRDVTDHAKGCLARCIVQSGKFGTFLASYGSQHHFAEESLRTKGLFAQLISCDHDVFRFITPFEQAVAYATRMPLILPVDLPEAFRNMGNAIAPPQALYCLTKALQTIDAVGVPSMDAMLLVIQFISQRPSCEDIRVLKTDDWYVMLIGDTIPDDMLTRNLQILEVANTPIDENLPPHLEMVHLAQENDPESDNDDRCEPSPKRPCRTTALEPITPTEHFELDTNCEGPDEFMEVPHINVTIVLPHDALVGRYPMPVTPADILQSRGYDHHRMMVRHVQGTHDVMHSLLMGDATLITILDCTHHVEHASRTFQGHVHTLLDQQQGDLKTTVEIRYQDVLFWKGHIGHLTPLETIHNVVRCELKRVGINTEIRWTYRGSAMNPYWGWKLNDISSAGHIRLFFSLPVSGGAPKGNKLDETQKTQLMAELVNAGIQFSDLVPAVTVIASSVGIPQILQAMQTSGNEARQKAVLDLAKQAGYHLDSSASKRKSAATKIQKAVRSKHQGTRMDLDVSTLSIDDHVFQNADKTAATTTTGNFEPNGTGVYLTTMESAAPWLHAANKISADELAILLVGHLQVDTSLPSKSIQFRAKQANGGILLLRGTLYQLGAKEVTQIEGKVTNIACPSTSVVTFTAYADEFNDMYWKDLTNSPGKCMLDAFDQETRRQAVIGIWGHSFQKMGKPAKPHDCDSVQIHARVITSKLQALLRQSGWNSIYMVPKGDDQNHRSMPDTQYAVIWTAQPKQETMVTAKEIQASLGLVRNRNSVGIRVAHGSFEEAWKKIHPSKDMPSSVQVQKVFRAQNLPSNITIVEIRQWLENIGWKAKPMKKLSHSIWLIGADGDPPQTSLVLNDNVILLTQQMKKPEAITPILAGRPIAQSRANAHETKGDGPITDAWATWKLNHPGQTAFQSSTPAPSVPPRQTEGPVNTKFAEQDAKIETLTRRLDDLNQQFQNDTQSLRQDFHKTVQHQENQISQFAKQVENRLVQQTTETDSKFHTLQAAVDQGRKAQEEQFEILRTMLLQNVNSSRKAAKTDGTTTPGGKDDGNGATN